MKKYTQWVFWKICAPVSILGFIWIMISGWPYTAYHEKGYVILAYVMLWILAPVTLDFLAATIFNKKRNIKKCAWCTSYKVTFISGKEEYRKWKYRKKDGTKDERKKDNFEQAKYISKYKCEKCNAITKFFHEESQSPGKNINILKRELLNYGEGERKGFDKESEEHKNGLLLDIWVFAAFWVCVFSTLGLIIFNLHFLDEFSIPSFWIFMDGRQYVIYALFAITAIYTYVKIWLSMFDDLHTNQIKILFWLVFSPILLYFCIWMFNLEEIILGMDLFQFFEYCIKTKHDFCRNT